MSPTPPNKNVDIFSTQHLAVNKQPFARLYSQLNHKKKKTIGGAGDTYPYNGNFEFYKNLICMELWKANFRTLKVVMNSLMKLMQVQGSLMQTE